MSTRRCLPYLALLATALHLLGMSRSYLPAQDGLKFIKTARRFQSEPWTEVVRSSDQHPLYPALVAVVEPAVSSVFGDGPRAWRISGQLISAACAVLLLFPLHALAETLFGLRAANLAVLAFVLLPLPAEAGHDTLSDSLGLLASTTALWQGVEAVRTSKGIHAFRCGLVSGIGYLARVEVLIVPVAVAIAWCLTRDPPTGIKKLAGRLALTAGAAILAIAPYAVVKGELSEKLAIRRILGTPSVEAQGPERKVPQWLPAGLSDPRWDFSAKEESFEESLGGAPRAAVRRFGQQWLEGMGWITLPFLLWGIIRASSIEGSVAGRRVVSIYAALFTFLVCRHAVLLGYLSGRHAFSMVVAGIPWVGAGLHAWTRGFPERRGLSPESAGRLGAIAMTVAIGVGSISQARMIHPSRWGYWQAGRWLAEKASPEQAVLDTRGWAVFVRQGPSYDYWHVRQALTDSKLAYIVVGADELKAKTPRAETLRAVLAYAAEPAASFPEREGGRGPGVEIYRFRRPESWQGILR